MAKTKKKLDVTKMPRCKNGSRRLPERIGRCVKYIPDGNKEEMPDYFDTPSLDSKPSTHKRTTIPSFTTPPPINNRNNIGEQSTVLTNTTGPTEEESQHPYDQLQLFESPTESIITSPSSIESNKTRKKGKIYFYNERKNPKNSQDYNNQTSSIFKTRILETNPYKDRPYVQDSGRDYTTKDFSFLEKANEMKNENGESVKVGYLYIISKILGKHLFFKVGISGSSITSTTGMNRLSNAQTFLVPGLKENAGFQVHFVFFFEMKDDVQVDMKVGPLIKKIESRVHSQLRSTFSEAAIMHSSGDRASEWFLVPKDEVEIFLGFVIDIIASTRVKPLEIQKFTIAGVDNTFEMPDNYKTRLIQFGISEQSVHSQRIEADLEVEYIVQLNGPDKKGTLDLYNKEFFQNDNKGLIRCFFPIKKTNLYIELHDIIAPSSNKNPEFESYRFYALIGAYHPDGNFPFKNRRVRKMFNDMNWYEGTVSKHDYVETSSGKSIRKVWKVKYDDGQEEDSYLNELLDIMIPRNEESNMEFLQTLRSFNITTIQPDKSESYVFISMSDLLELLRRFKISDDDYQSWSLKSNYEYYMSIKNGEFISRIEVSTKAFVIPQWYHDKQIQLYWARYFTDNKMTFYDGESIHWKVSNYEQEFNERGRYMIECFENVFDANGEEVNTPHRKKELFHVLRVMMWANANVIMREFEDDFVNVSHIQIKRGENVKVNDKLLISSNYFGSYNKFGYTNNTNGDSIEKLEYIIQRLFKWNNRSWIEVINSANDREIFFILVDNHPIQQQYFTKRKTTKISSELREPNIKDSWKFSGNAKFKKGDIIKINRTKYNNNHFFHSKQLGVPKYKQGQTNIIEFMTIHGKPEPEKGRYKIKYFPPYDKKKAWKKNTTKKYEIYYEYHPIEKIDLYAELKLILTRASLSDEDELNLYKQELRQIEPITRLSTTYKKKRQSSLNITKKK